MKALSDLQKDLDSRKYKSNPFEKKYVDLTTSSCVSSNTSNDNLGLEHLSKTIRTRADIINCQVAHLVKEASNVSVSFSADEVVSTKLKSKGKLGEQSDNFHDFFTNEDKIEDSPVSLLRQLETNPETSLPEVVMSAKLPYLEELLRSLKKEKLNKIISPFLTTHSELSKFLKNTEQKNIAGSDHCFKDDISNTSLVQHCSTEILISNTRSCIDSNLLQRHLDGNEIDTTCSLHKFLRYIKPFSFPSVDMISDNDRNDIEDENCSTIRDELKETSSMRLNSENSEAENVYHDCNSIYDCDDIASYDDMAISDTDLNCKEGVEKDISFIHSDTRVHTDEAKVPDKSKKVILRGANFMQLSNSDDSDESDCEFSVEKMKKGVPIDVREGDDKEHKGNDGKFGGKILLSKMRARINQSNSKKSNPSKCNDKVGKNIGLVDRHHKGTANSDLLSLEGAIKQMPTLLAFHTSQLNHDNAFAALPASSRRVVRVNNANELLLAIPPSSAPNSNGRATRRDRNRQTKDMNINEKRSIDSIQTLSTHPIEIISLKDPKLALCLPTNVANEGIHQDNLNISKEKGSWSPVGLGFGFDQNLKSLFEILRPEEFSFWQQNLQQGAQQRDDRDEWEGVANLFLPNVEGYDYREENWGWNCSEGYEYEGCYSEVKSEDMLCGGRIQEDFDDYKSKHEDNDYFDVNSDVDICSDNMSDIEKTSTPTGMHTPDYHSIDGSQPSFLSISRKRQHDLVDHRSNILDSSLNAPLNNAETPRQNITICKNMPFITSASSALTVLSRPLLPVSRIQQLLRGVMSSPPVETLLRLERVIPSSLITASYPTLGLQEGKLRYTKRVFVSLIFLADGYNRQQFSTAANVSEVGNASFSLKNPPVSTIQMLLSPSETSSNKVNQEKMIRNDKSEIDSLEDSTIQENNVPTVIINFR